MTQVAGSNITDVIAKESILSIQLSLNGLSFCIIHKGEIWFAKSENSIEIHELIDREEILKLQYKTVYVTVDSTKVCLTPKELFAISATDQYMSINGIEISPNEVIVNSDINKDIVATMALSRSAYDMLKEHFKAHIQFSHPLLINQKRKTKRPTVEANIGIGVVHITKINKNSLIYAESLPFKSTADILFYLQKLNDIDSFAKFDILISGLNSKQIYKDISRYFKNSYIDKVLFSYKIAGLSRDATAFNNIINVTYEDNKR